jgi:hypothetical protein
MVGSLDSTRHDDALLRLARKPVLRRRAVEAAAVKLTSDRRRAKQGPAAFPGGPVRAG